MVALLNRSGGNDVHHEWIEHRLLIPIKRFSFINAGMLIEKICQYSLTIRIIKEESYEVSIYYFI